MYSDLPVELLSMIWKLAVEKRVLKLQIKKTQIDEVDLGNDNKIKLFKLICANKVPKVLHVDRQSRAIGIEMYKAWDIRNANTDSHCPKLVYFHLDHDKIRCTIERPRSTKLSLVLDVLNEHGQLLTQIIPCIQSYPWKDVKVVCNWEVFRSPRSKKSKLVFNLSRKFGENIASVNATRTWEKVWLTLALA